MKGLMIRKPHDLVYIDLPVPTPADDEVLVRVAACGICMSDLEGIDGTRPEPYIKYPTVLGHEFSGVVEKCGKAVKIASVGQRVAVMPAMACGTCHYCQIGRPTCCQGDRAEHVEIGFTRNGGFSQYIVCKATQLISVPDDVPLELASLTEPGACVWVGVEATQPTLGDTVAVIGPGALGLLAVAFYRSLGASNVIIVGTRDDRNELAMKVGATHAININKQNALEELKKFNDGNGPDIVFESAGRVDAVKLALDAIRVGGAVALSGVAGVGKRIELECDYFLFRGIRLFGAIGYTPRGFKMTMTLLQQHRDQLMALLTHEYSLDDYEEAFKTVRERRGNPLKVLIKP
jgi:L-iditol 2-dehydrogenase